MQWASVSGLSSLATNTTCGIVSHHVNEMVQLMTEAAGSVPMKTGGGSVQLTIEACSVQMTTVAVLVQLKIEAGSVQMMTEAGLVQMLIEVDSVQ